MNGCENCAHKGTPSYKSPCSECRDFDKYEAIKPPLTNGDRIRAMTDAELAWELLEWRFDAYGKAKGDEAVLPSSQREIKDWLKQPVEEKT